MISFLSYTKCSRRSIIPASLMSRPTIADVSSISCFVSTAVSIETSNLLVVQVVWLKMGHRF